MGEGERCEGGGGSLLGPLWPWGPPSVGGPGQPNEPTTKGGGSGFNPPTQIVLAHWPGSSKQAPGLTPGGGGNPARRLEGGGQRAFLNDPREGIDSQFEGLFF